MIWIIEVPIIVFVIAAMFIGSLEIGATLRTIGWIMMALAAVVSIPIFNKRVDDKGTWLSAVWLLGSNAVICLIFGYLIGDLNLFEFLFGTGWF